MLEQEAAYHDSIAKRITIDIKKAKKFFAYDSPAAHIADRLPRLKQELLKALGNPKGKRVLVLGCGVDNAAIWFSKLGASVDSIDISPKSVENQRLVADLLNLEINSIVMDAHNLDFPSNEYDIVYGNAILHHLRLEDSIPEIVRVLKPDGRVVFRDVMRGNIFLRGFRLLTPFWRTPDEHPLKKSDLVFIGRMFASFESSQYILFGLPYFFFARIMNDVILKKMKIRKRFPMHNSIFAKFDRVDRVLFRLMPFLRNQAWLCLIVLTK